MTAPSTSGYPKLRRGVVEIEAEVGLGGDAAHDHVRGEALAPVQWNLMQHLPPP